LIGGYFGEDLGFFGTFLRYFYEIWWSFEFFLVHSYGVATGIISLEVCLHLTFVLHQEVKRSHPKLLEFAYEFPRKICTEASFSIRISQEFTTKIPRLTDSYFLKHDSHGTYRIHREIFSTTKKQFNCSGTVSTRPYANRYNLNAKRTSIQIEYLSTQPTA
jgi:hypothetical protein